MSTRHNNCKCSCAECSCSLVNLQIFMEGILIELSICPNSKELYNKLMEESTYILGPTKAEKAYFLVHGVEGQLLKQGDTVADHNLKEDAFIRVVTIAVKGASLTLGLSREDTCEEEILCRVQTDQIVTGISAPREVELLMICDKMKQAGKIDFQLSPEEINAWFDGLPAEMHATLGGLGAEKSVDLFFCSWKMMNSKRPGLPAALYGYPSKIHNKYGLQPVLSWSISKDCREVQKEIRRKMLPEILRILNKFDLVLPGLHYFRDMDLVACPSTCKRLEEIYKIIVKAQYLLDAKGDNCCHLQERIQKAAMNLGRIFQHFTYRYSMEIYPNATVENITIYIGPVRDEGFRTCANPPVLGFARIMSHTLMFHLLTSYNLIFPHVFVKGFCFPGEREEKCFEFPTDIPVDDDVLKMTVFNYLQENYKMTRAQVVKQERFYIAFHLYNNGYENYAEEELKRRVLQVCSCCHPLEKVTEDAGPNTNNLVREVDTEEFDINSVLRFIEGDDSKPLQESTKDKDELFSRANMDENSNRDDYSHIEELDTESDEELRCGKYGDSKLPSKHSQITGKEEVAVNRSRKNGKQSTSEVDNLLHELRSDRFKISDDQPGSAASLEKSSVSQSKKDTRKKKKTKSSGKNSTK